MHKQPEFIFGLLILVGVMLALTLTGCAPKPSRIEGSGIETPAPYGYKNGVDGWCDRNPTHATCGGGTK